MLANTVQHHEEIEDELEDIEALRKIAMESIKKKAKEDQQKNYSMFHSQLSQQTFASHSFPSARPQRMQRCTQFGGPPQSLMNYPATHNVSYYHPRSQPITHHEFAPIPHVNPQFMSQPQMFPNDYPLSIGMDFMPTPAVRLSPRSLEFVESNKKALMNANTKKRSRSKSPVSRRRYSRESRSRSRSPVKRRSSRSPYKKRRSSHDNSRTKYIRSKSPTNRSYKPRRMSSEKDVTTKSPNRSQTNRYNKKVRETRYNNGNKFNRKRSESDKEDESKTSPLKSSQSDKEIEEVSDANQLDTTQSLTSVVEESTTPPPLSTTASTVNRVKSQEEIENELLASSDDELELDIGVDENDLDFLDMDDSESENEGRFKDKPSTNVVKKQPTTLNNKNSLYSSKPFDKSRSYRNRDDRFRRRDHGSRKNSPDYRRNSPERKRSPKSIKDEDKPLFKPTFKSVESSEEKKNDDSKKSEKQSSIVRSAVMKAESNSKLREKSSSTVKHTITNEESAKISEPRKKKILDRLGGYIGGKAKSSSKQV